MLIRSFFFASNESNPYCPPMKYASLFRKLSLSFLAAAPVLGASELCAADVPAAGSKPNVIFILVDDMGWGDLNINWEKHGNAFGNRLGRASYKTPQLDKLANDGMLMLRHYTAAPVSVAARACLLTGMHTGHTRQIRDNTFDSPIADVHTLGSVMKGAGYSTAVIGKWGIGGGGQSGVKETANPLDRGFDYFYGHKAHLSGHFHYPANSATGYIEISENRNEIVSERVASSLSSVYAYSTDLFGARAKKWITDNDPATTKKPFFLLLTLTAPHASLRVPTCSYPSGGGKTGGLQWTTLSDGTGTCNTSTQALAEAAGATWIGRDGYIHPDNKDFSGMTNQRHSTMVRRVDDFVGDLRQLLTEMGIADNTVIVFTSDNGPHDEPGNDSCGKQDPTYFKTYGMMDGIKRWCHEGGMREPTIVCWPAQIAAGGTSLKPSQFQDWMATLADMAGVPVPASSSGVSLVPELTGEGERLDSDIYVEYHYNAGVSNYADFLSKNNGTTKNNQHVVYVDGFKGFVRDLNENSIVGDLTFEIYDTATDPQEANNLAGTAIDTMNNLQARMRAKLLQTRRALDRDSLGYGVLSGRLYFEKMANAVPANPPRVAASGLAWKVYTQDAAFPWVPDFRQTRLNAVAEGVQAADAGTAMPAAAKSQSGAVGVAFEGYIEVPTTGEYVFYLTTDSTVGSKAFAHLHGVMPLIDADKLYTPGAEASSYMNVGTAKTTGEKKVLLAAGKHPIRIGYVTSAGNKAPSLAMKWLKPGATAAEAIPASAFSRASDFGTETTEIAATQRAGKQVLPVNPGDNAELKDVTVSSPEDWIEVKTDAETGTLTVELEINTSGEERTGTITVENTVTGETQIITVTQAYKQAFEAWTKTEFTMVPPTTDAEVAAMEPDASWAGDGVSNLLKYALGLDPKAAYGSLGEVRDDAGTLKVAYPYNPATNDVTLIGERWDEATKTWKTDGVAVEKDADAGTLTLRSDSPMTTDATTLPRQFLRLRVVLVR